MKTRIFFVEDEQIVAMELQNHLTSMGYEVVGNAISGETAYEKILNVKPDIVLMDIMLKGKLDGIQTAQLINQSLEVPIIFLTAYADEQTLARAKNSTPYGYILKPFEERDLHINIEIALNKFRSDIIIKEKEKWNQAILNSIAEAVFSINNEGIIEYVNPKATELTSLSHDEMTGKYFRDIIKLYSHKSEKKIDEIISLSENSIKSNGSANFIFERYDGKRIPVLFSTSFVNNAQEHSGTFVCVIRDISEIKEYELELIEAKEKTQRLDKLKSEFLSHISHEIRTPMNSILNFSNILKIELAENIQPMVVKGLGFIEQSAKRLLRSIELVLDISTINSNNYNPTFTSSNIFTEILEPLIVEFKKQAESKNLKLVLINQIAEEPILNLDIHSIQNVFHNLIDNAIKFTDEGEIVIRIFKDRQTQISVEISDTGNGMSEEFIQKLFEPFSQEFTGYTRRFEGNGLGLALSKRYCELNSAQIFVESEVNKGSKFTVTFNNSK